MEDGRVLNRRVRLRKEAEALARDGRLRYVPEASVEAFPVWKVVNSVVLGGREFRAGKWVVLGVEEFYAVRPNGGLTSQPKEAEPESERWNQEARERTISERWREMEEARTKTLLPEGSRLLGKQEQKELREAIEEGLRNNNRDLKKKKIRREAIIGNESILPPREEQKPPLPVVLSGVGKRKIQEVPE
jgi:hypothetical protein